MLRPNIRPASKRLFQPSLNFVSIGAREEVEYVGKVNMNELYIQLPIMMAARLNLGKNYSASLSAGPYISGSSGTYLPYSIVAGIGLYTYYPALYGEISGHHIAGRTFHDCFVSIE